LDRAIDELLAQLKAHPVTRPAPPPFPDRSGNNVGAKASANAQ
jgi:hypothetical protein